MSEIRGHDRPVDAQDLDRQVLTKLQVDLGGNPLALLQIIRLFIAHSMNTLRRLPMRPGMTNS